MATAVCQSCNQEMDGASCTVETYDDFTDGVVRQRVRHKSRNGKPCGDCGCPSNGLHHPGCDLEKCPRCRRQAFSCGCSHVDDELDELETHYESRGPLVPNWSPLEQFFGASDAPELAAFMYMDRHDTTKFGAIHEYKHVDTRRYLMLNERLQTFRWTVHRGHFEIPRQQALDIAYEGVDDGLFMSTPGSLPRREVYACERNEEGARTQEPLRDIDLEDLEARLAPLNTIVTDARRIHRKLLTNIGQWSMKNGRGADLDTIALIVESNVEARFGDGESPFRWTRTSVFGVLWAKAHNYCSMRGGLSPKNIGEQMWVFLDYLADMGKLTESSDPLVALREPLHCYWWLDRNGKTRTDDGGRYSPCRCHVEYDPREQAA